MDNILIFKTASERIIERIETELNCEDKRIYYLQLQDDIGGLAEVMFSQIYIPSDSPYFRNYEEVFFSIDRLKYRTMILYDCYGNKRYYKSQNIFLKWIEYILSEVFFKFFTAVYKLKNMLRGNE